jgi:hypothetical protein
MIKLNQLLPVEAELRAEKAQAFGRTVRAFEQQLQRLHDLEARYAALAPANRPKLRTELERARKETGRRLWFLLVHREAIGIRRHENLYEVYRIPRSVVANP